MSQRLRWGILGTGNIARQFCAGVSRSSRSMLQAVASRDPARAAAFGGTHGVARACESYEQLLEDPGVDAVYVSLPNDLHCHWTVQALQAGKHVLCEKPLGLDATEAAAMFDAADAAGRVLMEAFMYRCHPQTLAVVDAVRRGVIGDLRLVRTSFCFRVARTEGNIRFNPGPGGGVLMDVGCYCIGFSRLLAGAEPLAVTAMAHHHAAGVDDVVVGQMTFPGGVLASFTCGMSLQADNTAYVCGSDGYLEVPVPWKPQPGKASFAVCRGTPPRMDTGGTPIPAPPPREWVPVDAPGDLYGIEADDFAAAVLDGTPARVSRQDTLGNLAVLDRMRAMISPGTA